VSRLEESGRAVVERESPTTETTTQDDKYLRELERPNPISVAKLEAYLGKHQTYMGFVRLWRQSWRTGGSSGEGIHLRPEKSLLNSVLISPL